MYVHPYLGWSVPTWVICFNWFQFQYLLFQKLMQIFWGWQTVNGGKIQSCRICLSTKTGRPRLQLEVKWLKSRIREAMLFFVTPAKWLKYKTRKSCIIFSNHTLYKLYAFKYTFDYFHEDPHKHFLMLQNSFGVFYTKHGSAMQPWWWSLHASISGFLIGGNAVVSKAEWSISLKIFRCLTVTPPGEIVQRLIRGTPPNTKHGNHRKSPLWKAWNHLPRPAFLNI